MIYILTETIKKDEENIIELEKKYDQAVNETKITRVENISSCVYCNTLSFAHLFIYLLYPFSNS